MLWEGPRENVLVSNPVTLRRLDNLKTNHIIFYTEQVYDAMHAAKKDVIHAVHHIL